MAPRFAALGLTSTLFLTGCGHGKPPQNQERPQLPAASVRAQAIKVARQASTEQVVGTIRAKLRATLEAKVSGRILEMPVTLGQEVKAGDLLARLDAAEIRARVQQAEAALEQAQREWKRTAALFEQQATTKSEYEAAESRLQIAKAGLAEAMAMVGYIDVQAPFAAVITRKWADRGDLAVPGKPLLSLEDPSALQMEADVPEAIGPRIQRGSRMEVLVDSLGQHLTGVVSEIAPTADPETRTCKIKLDLPPTKALMPGQFARLVVPVGETESLRAPAAAVLQRGQLNIVFVAADQRARMHLVKTGRQFGSEVEILSGLDSGDLVVVEGAAQLADGQPLQLR